MYAEQTLTKPTPSIVPSTTISSPVNNPRITRDKIQAGDILTFSFVMFDGKPSMTKLYVERIGEQNGGGFIPMKLSVIANTSSSPMKVNDDLWLECNTLDPHTRPLLDGSIEQHSFAHFVPVGTDGLNGFGTLPIEDLSIERKVDGEKQIIKPFEL